MRLTREGKEMLRELIDHNMRMLMDWTDFVEDAGVPLDILEGYLNCARDDVQQKHMVGIACALGIGYEELIGKLGCTSHADGVASFMKAQAKQTESVQEKVAQLERQCKKWLADGNPKDFEGPYNALWDLFRQSKKDKERQALASSIADQTQALGSYCHSHRDFLGLCGAYNDAHSLAEAMPESLGASRACVELAIGVFELKFHFREVENVKSYIDELMPVTARFPGDEEYTLHSAACLCNLLQLCPYDRSVFIGRMRKILERIMDLSERFPDNAPLQLCCLRSLVFFLCYGKPRLEEGFYEYYYELTNNAFAQRQGIVSERELSDMRYALSQSGIALMV